MARCKDVIGYVRDPTSLLLRIRTALSWAVTWPVLSYRGERSSSEFLRITLRQKTRKRFFSRYIRTFRPNFRICRARNWFRGNWRVSPIFQTKVVEKRRTAQDPSRKIAGENSRKAGPTRPFPGSNTPWKVLQPPFPVLSTSSPQVWPCAAFEKIRSTHYK